MIVLIDLVCGLGAWQVLKVAITIVKASILSHGPTDHIVVTLRRLIYASDRRLKGIICRLNARCNALPALCSRWVEAEARLHHRGGCAFIYFAIESTLDLTDTLNEVFHPNRFSIDHLAGNLLANRLQHDRRA